MDLLPGTVIRVGVEINGGIEKWIRAGGSFVGHENGTSI